MQFNSTISPGVCLPGLDGSHWELVECCSSEVPEVKLDALKFSSVLVAWLESDDTSIRVSNSF